MLNNCRKEASALVVSRNINVNINEDKPTEVRKSWNLGGFIKTALTDIVNAIDEAQAEVGDKATVMPYGTRTVGPGRTTFTSKSTNIDFDIAVASASEENRTASGKGGITVTGLAGIGLAKGAEVASSAGSVSRIRFSIQITLPHQECPRR